MITLFSLWLSHTAKKQIMSSYKRVVWSYINHVHTFLKFLNQSWPLWFLWCITLAAQVTFRVDNRSSFCLLSSVRAAKKTIRSQAVWIQRYKLAYCIDWVDEAECTPLKSSVIVLSENNLILQPNSEVGWSHAGNGVKLHEPMRILKGNVSALIAATKLTHQSSPVCTHSHSPYAAGEVY